MSDDTNQWPTRYQQLRQAVVRLASPADEQHSYLQSLLGHLTSNGDTSGYGNVELVEEFYDIYGAINHMRQWDEIDDIEMKILDGFDQELSKWSGPDHPDFWDDRQALWRDPRWQHIRECAAAVLASLPDEERRSGWQRGLE